MKYKNRKSQRKWAVPIIFVIGLSAVAILTISSTARSDYGSTTQQDGIRLETRLNQIEQRLYSIEASVRNLEQQSRVGRVDSRGVSQQDWAVLRSEVQTLQSRIIEDECALAKLDERTLPPEIRAARKRAGAVNNPCRMNFDTPLRLLDER